MELRGKRFLVIGGAGFIGSHTVDHLLREEVAEVRIFDNFSRGREANLATALGDARVNVFEAGGDILHRDILDAAMQGVDGVFHLAALWLLHCHDYPRSAFEVNVAGTFNVLEACVKHKVGRLVFSSSASVYGDAVRQPMDEDHPFNNKNFYGATKICGEAMARAMHHRYGLDYVGLRYMNVYGQRADHKGAYIAVIMKMLDAIDQGKPITIHGTGEESYDFVDVRDCGRANVAAMKASAVDSFYNVGTGVPTSLRRLAEMVMAAAGGQGRIECVPRTSSTLVRSRLGDPERARRELGFAAEIPLEEGLADLVAWRAANLRAGNPAQEVRT